MTHRHNYARRLTRISGLYQLLLGLTLTLSFSFLAQTYLFLTSFNIFFKKIKSTISFAVPLFLHYSVLSIRYSCSKCVHFKREKNLTLNGISEQFVSR